MEEEIQIRFQLKGEMAKKFHALKDDLGFSQNTAIIIHLINRAYRDSVRQPKA